MCASFFDFPLVTIISISFSEILLPSTLFFSLSLFLPFEHTHKLGFSAIFYKRNKWSASEIVEENSSICTKIYSTYWMWIICKCEYTRMPVDGCPKKWKSKENCEGRCSRKLTTIKVIKIADRIILVVEELPEKYRRPWSTQCGVGQPVDFQPVSSFQNSDNSQESKQSPENHAFYSVSSFLSTSFLCSFFVATAPILIS